ncbi:MAG TPA: hypothetical protein VNM47_18010 [Terriglobia bacterium]|nr:hypothetical protein [Terriglobia bacterium]
MKQTLKDWFAFAVCVSTVSVVISLFWCKGAIAQTPDKNTETPTIVIWVYNYARIPQDTMARTEREVQKILGAADVHVEWVDCPTSAEDVKVHPVCQERMSNAELGLTILPTAKGAANAYVDKYFGFAQTFNDGTFGHYAYVFVDRVRYRAQMDQISESELLASVICHEFGHVLLRSNTHSRSGIMRVRWDRDDLKYLTWGRLTFTPAERELIHSEAMARLRSSAGPPAISRNAVTPGNR